MWPYFIYRYQIFICWFASSNDKQHCLDDLTYPSWQLQIGRMRGGDSQASNVKPNLWPTLLGTNTSPTSQHFWVDNFPNFPRWGYVSEPWMEFFFSPQFFVENGKFHEILLTTKFKPGFLELPMEWNLKTRQDLEDITYSSTVEEIPQHLISS